MHKLKELYSSPTSELLVIRFEEGLLDATVTAGGGRDDYGDIEDLD